MKKRRVVITGLGIVSPVGNTIAEAWRNILNGNSGIATLENIDTNILLDFTENSSESLIRLVSVNVLSGM